MDNQNDHDTYIIPPSFVGTDIFFDGMFRARDVIETSILAFAIGLPVLLFLPFDLTAGIIVLCLAVLPLTLLTLIGISEESLSSFLIIFLKFLRNRRVVGKEISNDTVSPRPEGQKLEKQKQVRAAESMKDRRTVKAQKSAEGSMEKRRRTLADFDFPAEFDEIREYKIKQKLRPCKGVERKRAVKLEPGKRKHHSKQRPHLKKAARTQEPAFSCSNPVADYFPITKIENGVICTKGHHYIKVVEVVPINFMLRSAREQRSIIYFFIFYLKISPVKLQFKTLTRRADISRRMDAVRCKMATETNEQCRLVQGDYLKFV